MGDFSKQSWSQRMKIAGDYAENAFREYAKENNIHVERYGFDRSSLPLFYKLPRGVKSTPDFACTTKHKEEGYLVECKGCGSANHVKIKVQDIIGLRLWLQLSEVYVFIYERIGVKQRYSMVAVDALVDIITTNKLPRKSFDDGNEYWEVPKKSFEWTVMDDRQKETE